MFKKGDIVEASEQHLLYHKIKDKLFYVVEGNFSVYMSERDLITIILYDDIIPYKNNENIKIHKDYATNYKFNLIHLRKNKIEKLKNEIRGNR